MSGSTIRANRGWAGGGIDNRSLASLSDSTLSESAVGNNEGRRWIAAALALDAAQGQLGEHARLRVGALNAGGVLAHDQGDYEEGERAARGGRYHNRPVALSRERLIEASADQPDAVGDGIVDVSGWGRAAKAATRQAAPAPPGPAAPTQSAGSWLAQPL